jgi:hypothetical protein
VISQRVGEQQDRSANELVSGDCSLVACMNAVRAVT